MEGKKEGKNINTMVVQEIFRMLSANMEDKKKLTISIQLFPAASKATSPFEKRISKLRNSGGHFPANGTGEVKIKVS